MDETMGRPRSARYARRMLGLAATVAMAVIAGTAGALAQEAPPAGEDLVVLAYGERTSTEDWGHVVYNPVTDQIFHADDRAVAVRTPEDLSVVAQAPSRAYGSHAVRKLAVDPTRGWVYHNTRRSDDEINVFVPQTDGTVQPIRLGSEHTGVTLPDAGPWVLTVDPGSGVLHLGSASGPELWQVEPLDEENPANPDSWVVRPVSGGAAVNDWAFVAPGTAVAVLTEPVDGARFAVVTIDGAAATVTPIAGIEGPGTSSVAESGDGTVYLVAGRTAQRFAVDGHDAAPVEDPVALPYEPRAGSVVADPGTGSLFVGFPHLNQTRVDEYRDGRHVGTVVRDRLGANTVRLAPDGRGGVVAVDQYDAIRVGRGTPAPAPEEPDLPAVIESGHLDVSPALRPDGPTLILKDATGEQVHWRESDDVVLHLKSTPDNTGTVPEGSPLEQWLGPAGTELVYAPESSIAGLIWPGWSNAQMSRDVKEGHPEIELASVDGPGEFVMYNDASNPLLASRDLSRVYRPSSHTHQTWAFAGEGVWRLTFTIRAETLWGEAVEGTSTLTFTVGDVDPPGPVGVSETIVATLDEDDGALVVSLDPDDRTVILPDSRLAADGESWETTGDLRPVTVTDTRAPVPGWNVSAQVSDFESDAGTLAGSFLGWTPTVLAQAEGQGVESGEAVAPGFPDGDGLSVPRTLASAAAGAGTGTAVLGAGLELRAPTQTRPGAYEAVLTFTAI